MTGRIVTVFGGSGFIGRHVVRALCRQGWRVRVACRRPHLAGDVKLAGDVGQVQLVQANVRNRPSIKRALENAEAVVNLVGILTERGSQSFQGTQALGASNIASAAAEAGITKFVQLSAIGASKTSRARYAQTKAEAEEAVRAAIPTATILRPSIVFGPEDGFFTRFAEMARLSPVLPCIGGSTKFQPVYVGDVAQAVAAALARDDSRGRIYELGGPRAMSMRQVLQFVLEHTRRCRPLVPLPEGLVRFQARLGEMLPTPPLTRDQLILLGKDNLVADGAVGFAALGIEPKAVEAIVPAYLARYRAGGSRREAR